MAPLWTLLKKLGWFYLAALAVCAGALKLFTELAQEVLERSADPVNRQVLLTIHQFARPTLDQTALLLSAIGGVIGTGLVSVVMGAWLLHRGRNLDVATLAATILGGSALTVVLKSGFQQTRPDLFPRLTEELTFSFPSGHALMAFSLYGFIAVWCVIQGPRQVWRWAAAAGCLGLASAIAASRLYLGVHWPTDVIGGALIATFWLCVCMIGRQWITTSMRHVDSM